MLKIPRLATERALISAGRKERSLVKSMETLILGWSLKLAPLIRLDAYKRRRLETKLTAAGLDMTPEVFTAYTVLKPCLILLGIIPCLLILPILTPLVVVLALLTYFKESRRADELCKARMELVEGELPRFVATIHQELAASRDVLRMHLKLDNCSSRSEFVMNALKFYVGYLNTKNASAFLPEVLSATLTGTLDGFAGRISSLLFKQGVDINLMAQIIAYDTDIDEGAYERLRGKAIRDMKRTNGRISFKDVLDFQKSV